MQDYFTTDQEINADTNSLSILDSEKKADPDTFDNFESHLQQLERVADKLSVHFKRTSRCSPIAALKTCFKEIDSRYFVPEIKKVT